MKDWMKGGGGGNARCKKKRKNPNPVNRPSGRGELRRWGGQPVKNGKFGCCSISENEPETKLSPAILKKAKHRLSKPPERTVVSNLKEKSGQGK